MIKLNKVLLLSHLSAGLSAAKAYVDSRISELAQATLEAMGDVESSIDSLEKSKMDKPEGGSEGQILRCDKEGAAEWADASEVGCVAMTDSEIDAICA